MPDSVSERGVTAMMPTIEVMTPTALMKSGNITPMMAPLGDPAKAAAPRISEAISVTSED
jgi:hypothetical protein